MVSVLLVVQQGGHVVSHKLKVEALSTARTGVTIPCRLPEGHTKK